MMHFFLAQLSAIVNPEWIYIGVVVSGMWGRMEYRLGKLEGKIDRRR